MKQWHLHSRGKEQKTKGYQARYPQEQVIREGRQKAGYPIYIIYDKKASWLCKLVCVTCTAVNSTWNILLIHSVDGGSTVIQQRIDGSVDFDQTWEKYEKGFGELESE